MKMLKISVAVDPTNTENVDGSVMNGTIEDGISIGKTHIIGEHTPIISVIDIIRLVHNSFAQLFFTVQKKFNFQTLLHHYLLL